MPLTFSTRPTKVKTAAGLQRQRWLSRDRDYQITRLLGYTGAPYISTYNIERGRAGHTGRWIKVGENRTLAAAQAACERHARGEQ